MLKNMRNINRTDYKTCHETRVKIIESSVLEKDKVTESTIDPLKSTKLGLLD